MITTSEKVKAGIFFVIGVALFVLFLSFLGYIETRQKGEVFHSFFTGVESLHKGAPVKYNGVQVGKVTDIHVPTPGEPEVRIDYVIENPELVTPNTCAKLAYVSYLSGNQGISLEPREPGSRKTEKVKDNRIPTVPSEMTMAFETLLDSVNRLNSLLERNGPHIDELFLNSNKVLTDLQDLLSGERTLEDAPEGSLMSVAARLDKLVKNLTKTSERLDATLQDVQVATEKGGEAFGSVQSLSTDVNDMVNANDKQISRAIKDLSVASKNLRATSQSLDSLLQDNHGTLNTTLRHIRHSTRDLQDLLKQLRAKPSLLISSPTPKKRRLDK